MEIRILWANIANGMRKNNCQFMLCEYFQFASTDYIRLSAPCFLSQEVDLYRPHYSKSLVFLWLLAGLGYYEVRNSRIFQKRDSEIYSPD